MYLRKLKLEDAPLMLEWMHDASVTEHLAANFAGKTVSDCENFIISSRNDDKNLHLAVAAEDDTYMGTVSLKQIDRQTASAEFAISMRSCAMGKGYARYAMFEIIRMGLDELGLKQVYWCVSQENKRACRFYDKNGFCTVTDIPAPILARYADQKDLRWYRVDRSASAQ